jgi:hypothetical protein
MASIASGNSSSVSGANLQERTGPAPWVVGDAGGNFSGNTYNGTDSQRLIDSYEAIFGPAGRDIKYDPQRHKRHQRWHLPDNLKGRNEYLTDRIDGLITDATNSPFTRNILPYAYLDSPDQRIKWNVYSFDEGMASRVPYESAARVLTQSKTSHSGYAIRQGLAIVMEHNFLASAAGMANFQNQLKQLVGSIQLTNDLDVHVALLQAQSYQKTVDEKYYSEHDSLYDAAKRYVDMFGIMQKMPNALDILIEDAKNHLKTWGSQPPTFLLCPSDLTAQLQMSPERTNYITNGPDGLKRLAQGPDLPSYRGLSIIHSQKFSLEPGRKPRNVLKRKVRVAEYYWLDLGNVASYQIYNQKKDMMTTFDKLHALKASQLQDAMSYMHGNPHWESLCEWRSAFERDEAWDILEAHLQDGYCLLIRPNIEHDMLTVIAGRGGTQELGATFWGQTELACYDDAQHGIWGMSYKYHERAIVTNERNLIRMFDVAFDGYSGGMDTDIAKIKELDAFTDNTYSNDPRYTGPSVIAMHFPRFLPPRPIKNVLMRLLLRMFMPQWPQHGTYNDLSLLPSAELAQYDKILEGIYIGLKGLSTLIVVAEHLLEAREIVVRLEGKANLTTSETTELRNAEQTVNDANDRDSPLMKWSSTLADLIMRLIETYQKVRPQESPEILYRRILQNLYQEFRSPLSPMSDGTATGVLNYLLGLSPGIKSEQFKITLKVMLELLMINWQVAVNGDTGIVGTEQTKTQIICLTHGIQIPSRNGHDNNEREWSYSFNGATYDYAGMLQLTRHENHEFNNGVKALELCEDFNVSLDRFNDIRYIVHRMQKPAFEIPNPVILSTFLRDDSQIMSVSAEGATAIDKEKRHNFYYQFIQYFEEDRESEFAHQGKYMTNLIKSMFAVYDGTGSHLWTVNNIVPAATYMQNNATELPSCAYHGNLLIDKVKGVREEIRCVGHLGNSFPGCSTIRQGKGMLNMYERMPLPIHVM